MTTPSTPSDRQAQSQKLVQELLQMRDALVTLSLSLRDWQFELDQQGRQAARQQAEAALAPMRLQAQPRDNMIHIKNRGNSLPD
jgi:hypothetical protein